MLQEIVKVLFNTRVGPGYFRIGLACNPAYARAVPGQFVMLRRADQIMPLLRRPFSIHRRIQSNGKVTGIEILYKVVGEFTGQLAGCQPGEALDLLGPLGRGFSIADDFRSIFIVAGGIGVAPLLFLAATLGDRLENRSGCRVFIGGRSADDLLCGDEFADLGMAVSLNTDDGSLGDQCLVTTPLEQTVAAERPQVIYACGPVEMLKCVAGIAARYAVPCQLSIESVMACGVGACLGCAVEAARMQGAYLHACRDGPVFDADTVRLGISD